MCINKAYLLFLLGFLAMPVYASNIITVNCTGIQPPDISSDRQMIQDAINKAKPGDTIKIIGTCQLDGSSINIVKSNVTLTGVGKDGNWGTVLKGLTTPSGSPMRDGVAPTVNYFNRGIRIGPTDMNISNVTISNIKFQSLNFAVDVIPEVSSSSNRCDAYTGSSGTGSNIIVSSNLFDNNWGAIEVLGQSNNVQIKDNLVTNAVHYDFVIWGLNPPHYCINVVPGHQLISLGAPNNISITGNVNQNDNWFISLDVINANHALVANNKLTNANGGEIVFMSGDTNTLVTNNIFDGGGQSTGFYISDAAFASNASSLSSSNVNITNNQINNTYPGILLDSSTTGYKITANQFNGTIYGIDGYPNLGDVFLCDDGNGNSMGVCSGFGGRASFNNMVVGSSCTQVIDLGIGNQLLGLISASNNINEPPSSTCK